MITQTSNEQQQLNMQAKTVKLADITGISLNNSLSNHFSAMQQGQLGFENGFSWDACLQPELLVSRLGSFSPSAIKICAFG